MIVPLFEATSGPAIYINPAFVISVIWWLKSRRQP